MVSQENWFDILNFILFKALNYRCNVHCIFNKSISFQLSTIYNGYESFPMYQTSRENIHIHLLQLMLLSFAHFFHIPPCFWIKPDLLFAKNRLWDISNLCFFVMFLFHQIFHVVTEGISTMNSAGGGATPGPGPGGGQRPGSPRSPGFYKHRNLDTPKTIMDVDYKLLNSGIAVLPGKALASDQETMSILMIIFLCRFKVYFNCCQLDENI